MPYQKVILGSGHLTDKPDRPKPRFPEAKVGAVRERIVQQLEAWQVNQDDLVICGGARGADILFAESAIARGAECWLHLALPENEFIEQSIRQEGTDWEKRYLALSSHPLVKVQGQPQHEQTLPNTPNPFAAANIAMIQTAKEEASAPQNIYALLVWDEQPTGDGPGGTSDFEQKIRATGGTVAVINPTGIS